MKVTVEVEAKRFEDARLIARALTRALELEREGTGVAISVVAGTKRRSIRTGAYRQSAEAQAISDPEQDEAPAQ